MANAMLDTVNSWKCVHCSTDNHTDLPYCEGCGKTPQSEASPRGERSPSPPNAEPYEPYTVDCDFPGCGEKVLFSEYGVHYAKHKSKQVPPKQAPAAQVPPRPTVEIVDCDWPGCGERVLRSQYAKHTSKHKQESAAPAPRVQQLRVTSQLQTLAQQPTTVQVKTEVAQQSVWAKYKLIFYSTLAVLYQMFMFSKFQACIISLCMAVTVNHVETLVRGGLYLSAYLFVLLVWNFVRYLIFIARNRYKNRKIYDNNNKGGVHVGSNNKQTIQLPLIWWILVIVIFGLLMVVFGALMLIMEHQAWQDDQIEKNRGSIIDNFNSIVQNRLDIDNLKQGLYDLTNRVSNVEELAYDTKSLLQTTVTNVDNRFESVQKDIQTLYETKLDKSEKLKWMDDIMVYTAGKIKENPRKWIGLGGCFIKGTKIATDYDHYSQQFNFTSVETLRNGSYVYNAIIGKRMKITTWIWGTETGVVYNITTSDLLSVIVTETHPMIICNDNYNDIYSDGRYSDGIGRISDECMSVAAEDVSVGNSTLTVNGRKRIVNIDEIEVTDALVFNFMFDESGYGEENGLPLLYRGINANGIYTLDLYAQSLHHKRKQG